MRLKNPSIRHTGQFGNPPPHKNPCGVLVHRLLNRRVNTNSIDSRCSTLHLKLASLMAGDHDVLVYFDIEEVNAALKDSGEIAFTGFEASQKQLQELASKNVILMACPACLKAAGKSADALAAGVQLADKGKFFSFTQGRILTLDY